ncbi:MAG: type VI secretion system membrane subunit TssM [Acidobacteriota bacterium]
MPFFSQHKERFRAILSIFTLIAIYGVAGILTWLLGSSYGLSTRGQIILIGIILLTFPFALLINYFIKRRGEKSADTKQKFAEQRENPSEIATANYLELKRDAEEAVQWLRNTKLATTQSGDVVYQLPWFLVAGPPASGKTSMLLLSGLDYHILPSKRSLDENVIQPTQYCEWRITDEAVFIDTAGRFQKEGADGNEWSVLLNTIKQYRKDRPIDGLIISVNAGEIIGATEAQIEQQAKSLRTRIDETMKQVETRFPVYLIFTHANAISGFEEFFRTYDHGGRAQAWGATIPLQQAGHPIFDIEFDYLYDAMIRHRLVRLGEPAVTAEQLLIFDFPIRFSEAANRLALFATALFRPNPFHDNPLVRGFYLINSSIERRLVAAPIGATIEKPANEAAMVAKEGYFIEDLFRQILLRDKDLAASFQIRKREPYKVQRVLTAIAVIVMLFLVGGFFISLSKNRELIADGVERAARVEEFSRAEFGKQPIAKEPAALRAELEALESLRETLERLDTYHQASPPFSHRFGLYSGNAINPNLRAIYFEVLTRRFFKPAVAALEKDLQGFTSEKAQDSSKITEEDLGRYYDRLKTYLMLSDPEKREPVFLANQLADYWQGIAPPDMELVARQQLEFYAHQAIHNDVPHIKANDQLVAESRRLLTAYPAINRFYKRLTSEIDNKVAAVSTDTILQGRGRGWITGTYTVAGSFTVEGYHNYMSTALKTAAEEMGKEDWVMGSVALPARDLKADIGKLQSLYFRDYTAQWQRFIKGIVIMPFRNRDEAVEAMRLLSASDSPMVLLAAEVARQTNLSANPQRGGITGWIKSLFSSAPTDITGVIDVEKEFKPLQEFMAEPAKEASRISQYRAVLRTVLDSLEGASADQLAQTSRLLLTGKDDIGLHKAELSVNKLTENFKTAAAADSLAFLRQPLGNLRAMLYGSGYEQIERSWKEQIFPKAHALEAGFPFTNTGEAAVTDLARFFNPVNGQFTLFFNDKLATSLEDAQGRWRLKETGAFKFSPDFINYLNGVRQLRDALFPHGGQQPEVNYEITLQPVAGSDIVLEIDGIRAETRGNTPQSAKFVWPARAGSSGVKITVITGGQIFERAYPGEWGLFKMVAAGGPNLSAGGNQFQLAWNIGNTTVRALLRPSSTINPFQRNLFAQLRAPQELRE